VTLHASPAWARLSLVHAIRSSSNGSGMVDMDERKVFKRNLVPGALLKESIMWVSQRMSSRGPFIPSNPRSLEKDHPVGLSMP
jgi:hypothetical protein